MNRIFHTEKCSLVTYFQLSPFCSYTADQVQGRWSTLVTLYQRMVEHNSKPHNEPINIAFKDHIERVFKYVPERNSKWLKIMEKRGKTPKTLKSK